MPDFKKIFLSFFLIVLLAFILIGSFSVANAERELEIKYPEAFGKITTETGLPEYVKYIFNFAVGIGCLIAFAALVYGGILYLTSAGSPSVMGDAKNQIFSAILGLAILLFSYVILVTINPQLTIIKIEKIEPGKIEIKPLSAIGVYLFEKDYKEKEQCVPDVKNGKCLRVREDIADLKPPGFNDTVRKIKFTNDDNNKFWAILHEDTDFEGQCKIFFEDKDEIRGTDKYGTVDKPSSVTVFRKGEAGAGDYVTVCSQPDFTGVCKTYGLASFTTEPMPLASELDNNVHSIKIEGNYLAVLFDKPVGDKDFPGKCEVFRKSDSDLKDNPIGRCGTIEWKFGFIPWYTFKSCVSAIAIYPTK